MSAASNKAVRGAPGGGGHFAIADLVLVRVATGGANRAALQRDLASLVAPRISGTMFRREAELAIDHHVARQLIVESKGHLAATMLGNRAAEALLGVTRPLGVSWDGVRGGPLVARALGVACESPAMAKALDRLEGLAALMLQKHFDFALARVLSPADLRAELAVIALERAFGNKIKTGLGKGSGLPGKTARLLAGQLFRKPREISSDGRLLSALAADLYEAPAETLDGLRLAVIRRLTAPADAPARPIGEKTAPVAPPRAKAPAPKPANDWAPLAAPPPQIARPDMPEFAGAVIEAARPVSEGWPGNRKAFISRVWQAIRNARPEWELSEIAFKSMLAEAHRSGRLVLAGADLKDKGALKDLEASKILYKNTVWHYVRVED